MNALTLETIARYCGGRLIQGVPSAEATGVSTDSRSLCPGELFVALKGDCFDGHRYLEEVAEKGAAAVVVSELPASTGRLELGIVHVPDTLAALQALARRYRRDLDLEAVVITGSSGKTSTKDFVAAVLGRRYPVNATQGNLNNHIGLPLTILRSDASHAYGVWEIGMSNPGEIELLAEMARPDLGLITNIGTAHLEYMETQDAIGLEKGMLAEAVGPAGCVVLNADDEFTPSIAERTRARVITAGIDGGDLRARAIAPVSGGSDFVIAREDEETPVHLPVPGRHMVSNALLAAAVGFEAGLSGEEIAAGLGEARLTGGRLERKERDGVVYLDDSYNANPDSMRAALDTLAAEDCPGRRIAVLGVMAELGGASASEHEAIGRYAAERGIDHVVSVGEEASPIARSAGAAGVETTRVGEPAEAAAALVELAREGDLVLLKGSRSARMETVLESPAPA